MFRTVPLSIIRRFSGRNVLILLASCQKTCMTYHFCAYSEKLLMMDRGTVRNIYLNINQLDALNFIMSLFHASTCFEHMC